MLSYREETRGPLQRLPTLTGAQGRHQHLGSGPGRFRFGVCQSRCRIGAYQPSNSTDILHQALRTSRRLALCNICRMLGICVCSQSSTSPCSNNLCLKGSSLQITFYYEPPPPPKTKTPNRFQREESQRLRNTAEIEVSVRGRRWCDGWATVNTDRVALLRLRNGSKCWMADSNSVACLISSRLVSLDQKLSTTCHSHMMRRNSEQCTVR